ncbi:MAG: TatD family hydrolase [Spirochaetaceae bacterium]|jgi:TatD DNase family protein|nr:TatD family hydrolase [Spirochaetaceae bacterium]
MNNRGIMAGFTDTHCHLSYLEERGIPRELTASLFDSTLDFALDIGTEAGDLERRVEKLSAYSAVRFAAGIWPHAEFLARAGECVLRLERSIEAAPRGLVAAIGECGYDRRENPRASEEERELLELQLELAKRRRLPVIIHSREAPGETLESLRRFPGVRGVIHCFSYGDKEAAAFLDLGYYISFAGNLTYKSAGNLRETLRFIPRNRLLLETDAPFLAPASNRGKTCHPGMITETYKCAAELCSISLDRLKEVIAGNSSELFLSS